ncbi:MAG: hypothetical protein JXB48_05520 [Candidatus Latescibacteria bacterium]|nr:hypothetical protein [Candidatus Latescibacterota bacterium]
MKLNTPLKILVLAIVILGMAAILSNPGRFGSYFSTVDRNDYKAVAENFLRKNVYIAKRIGKVDRLSHVGDGGGSGTSSYNLYRLYGSEKEGVCDVTVEKDDTGNWYVTYALLTIEGMEYKIPIKRSGKRKLPKIW